LRLLVGVLALLAVQSSTLGAQQVQLRTQAGLYLPTRVSIQSGSLHLNQKIGFKLGAHLILAFSDRFDVVTGVTYIPGYAVLQGAGKLMKLGAGSHELGATARARYWLLPQNRVLSWDVHTGLGMAAGRQRGYESLFEGSTLSAVIGTTVRYQLGRIVSLRLRIQERLYRVRFGGGDVGGTGSPLRVSFGLSFPFLSMLRSVEPQYPAREE
jgi:hypothetical protein